MTSVVRFQETGAPTVLHVTETDRLAPGPKEVWIEQEAIGVNYLDVTQRNGAVPVTLPSGLGIEAAGRVADIGAEVTNVSVGDRVAYALGPLGSYASGRLYPAERLLVLPETLAFDDVAGVLVKGLTAQYLIRSTYPIGPGKTVLLYGAAGAVGQVLAAWATSLGAFVIGVVSRETSVDRATAAGCAAVLVWGQCDVAAEVTDLTGGKMADVVYDGVGKTTFNASINSLRTRGMMVSIGASSGLPDPVGIDLLNKKSLFLTRPGLGAHISEVSEYKTRAADVFNALLSGVIKPNVWTSFPLSDVAQAHTILENGKAEGAIILKP